MKIRELEERANVARTHEHGTIAKLSLDADSRDSLTHWCKEHRVPCIDGRDLHCTVLFSKKPVEHLTKNAGRMEIEAAIVRWKKLGPCLTLELDCPIIHKMHEWMIKSGGTHDYPTFIAHTTISYDWGEDTDIPEEIPELPLVFNRLIVQPIDIKYASKAKTE